MGLGGGYKRDIPSELELITEGGNTGWRILGRDPANYGDIGDGAVDFSYSLFPSTTKGATGQFATSGGVDTVAAGDISLAFGDNSEASSYGSTVMGVFPTIGAGQTGSSIVSTDELFKIGNGTGTGARADALVMLKDGTTALNGTLTVSNTALGPAFEVIQTHIIGNAAKIGIITNMTSGTAPVLTISANTSNTAADEFGGLVVFDVENDAGTDHTAARIKTTLSDVSDGIEEASFSIQTSTAGGTPTDSLILLGNGEATLPKTEIADITSAGDKAIVTKEYGDANYDQSASATDAAEGLVELATQTEVNTGTDATRVVTPDTLEDKTYGTFTGSTITDNSTLKTALQELETAVETSASQTVEGIVELATVSEINTGTDVNRVMSVDDFASSDFGTVTMSITAVDSQSAVTTGDAKASISIGSALDGYDLVSVTATVEDKGVTGTTDVVVRRWRGGAAADMTSTAVTIGDEWFAADGVIDTANDDLLQGDRLYIDVDAIHSGTAPNGLDVVLEFRKP